MMENEKNTYNAIRVRTGDGGRDTRGVARRRVGSAPGGARAGFLRSWTGLSYRPTGYPTFRTRISLLSLRLAQGVRSWLAQCVFAV